MIVIAIGQMTMMATGIEDMQPIGHVAARPFRPNIATANTCSPVQHV